MTPPPYVYKYEIAQMLQISCRSLCRLLNEKYFEQLSALGYEKKQKYLNPCQLNWLKEKIDFSTDENK